MDERRHPSVDHARAILADLIEQKQSLSRMNAESSLVEANRLGIVYWRLQLTRALAAREVTHAGA